MKENGRNKREWVKTAAIVFLTVMLILTFFSNTFMNYSLPEVATQYVQSGTITAKIRGSGTVESSEAYRVEVTESRKIASVAVREGDAVQKGDVLVYLEDVESDELKAAMEALETAQDEYDRALLSVDITAADILAANRGISIDAYRGQITAAQNAVTAAEEEVDEAKAFKAEVERIYNEFDEIIKSTPENIADVSEEQAAYNGAKTDWENAKFAADNVKNMLTEKQNILTPLQEKYNRESSISGNDVSSLAQKVRDAQSAVTKMQAAYDAALLEVSRKKLVMDQAEKRLNDKKESGDTKDYVADLEKQKNEVKKNLEEAKALLERREGVLADQKAQMEDLTSQIDRTLGLVSYKEKIAKAREKVEELRAKAIGTTIDAPISGTVTSLNAIAGGTTSVSTPVAELQPEGKGFTMEITVTNEQAKRLSVGDKADLVNAWRYDDVTVTLAGIKPDKTDPGQKKLLTFDVTGSVVAGQTLNISVGQKSANYDLIVPNSAIREDNNGKFILIVESKSSPLGTRYYASRVDVEVLASDDTQSAISAALYGYEFVITTSTKPVEAGKLIRLSNN